MRVLVIVNDRAGAGDAGLYQFVRLLGLANCEIVLRYIPEQGDVAELAADADAFDRIVVAGGDGTVSAVCYATRTAAVPLLPFPAGTANLLAYNLGLPLDPPALAEILLEGVAVAFDLGELTMTAENGAPTVSGFIMMAGAGYDATIMEGAVALKPTLGPAAYLVSAMSNLMPEPSTFNLVIDGREIRSQGIAVLLVNFSRLQFDLPITPDSDPRDGLFEVTVLRTKTAMGLLPALTAAMLDRSGEYLDRTNGLELYRGAHIEVAAEPAMRAQSDGDAHTAMTPFSARVLPSAARLLVAPGSYYAQEPERAGS